MIGPISQINISGGLSEKETSSLISNEELKNIITQLETDISDGSWFHKNYSRMDVEVMPALVIQANNKYPEMNLNLVTSPLDLSIEIKNVIENGVRSSPLHN